jgi:hypothetical protein
MSHNLDNVCLLNHPRPQLDLLYIYTYTMMFIWLKGCLFKLFILNFFFFFFFFFFYAYVRQPIVIIKPNIMIPQIEGMRKLAENKKEKRSRNDSL